MNLIRSLKRIIPRGILRKFSLDEKDLEAMLFDVQTIIDYQFQDIGLLIRSLKHRSYVYFKEEDGIDSNERLEFLGDAVLNLVVTEYLHQNFPQKREGELTQIKSLMVSKTILARKARKINLGAYVLLSPEEEASGGRERTSIISDAYEALLGAIYTDGGLDSARRFISNQILSKIQEIASDDKYVNFKSSLLEHAQKNGRGQPEYSVNSEEGPDHQKIFTIEVSLESTGLGKGTGKSKKQAEQRAAKEALKKLGAFKESDGQ